MHSQSLHRETDAETVPEIFFFGYLKTHILGDSSEDAATSSSNYPSTLYRGTSSTPVACTLYGDTSSIPVASTLYRGTSSTPVACTLYGDTSSIPVASALYREHRLHQRLLPLTRSRYLRRLHIYQQALYQMQLAHIGLGLRQPSRTDAGWVARAVLLCQRQKYTFFITGANTSVNLLVQGICGF
jgi:hypothetical protein